jgi:hypothetical protein
MRLRRGLKRQSPTSSGGVLIPTLLKKHRRAEATREAERTLYQTVTDEGRDFI